MEVALSISHCSVDNDEGSNTAVERVRVLVEFGRAWSARDIHKLMELVTDDCVYCASVGPEPGHQYVGRDAVRKGFEEMLAYDATGRSREGRSFVAGDLGVMEWSYVFSSVFSSTEGHQVEVRGCDIVEFRGLLICRKDAFRKSFE